MIFFNSGITDINLNTLNMRRRRKTKKLELFGRFCYIFCKISNNLVNVLIHVQNLEKQAGRDTD